MKILLIALTLVSASAYANLRCGLPPLPPLGCQIGACVCDAQGNCSWQYICN